jgi:hypothetical protein
VGESFLRHFVLGALIVATPASTLAAEGVVTIDCPGYLAHVLGAQTKLERGNRPAALAEMAQAKTALEDCLREQVSETALAAARPANDSVCD